MGGLLARLSARKPCRRSSASAVAREGYGPRIGGVEWTTVGPKRFLPRQFALVGPPKAMQF